MGLVLRRRGRGGDRVGGHDRLEVVAIAAFVILLTVFSHVCVLGNGRFMFFLPAIQPALMIHHAAHFSIISPKRGGQKM
ncbi:MAG: hypothetical protein M5U34_31365 [Chloroflexi bacterium]|nr:hypothetical protein [Chloroflexota bacterium]